MMKKRWKNNEKMKTIEGKTMKHDEQKRKKQEKMMKKSEKNTQT